MKIVAVNGGPRKAVHCDAHDLWRSRRSHGVLRQRQELEKHAPDLWEDYDGGEMDACIVGTQMMYMATELGLGTLWARGFNATQIHDVMGLPENIIVSFLLDVGYPAEGSVNHHTPRRSIGEMVVEL